MLKIGELLLMLLLLSVVSSRGFLLNRFRSVSANEEKKLDKDSEKKNSLSYTVRKHTNMDER